MSKQLKSIEPILMDRHKVLDSIETNGVYKEDGVIIKKWESDKNGSSLVADIKRSNLSFLGIIDDSGVRDGYAKNSFKNGDKYLGNFGENEREKNGFYIFKPEIKDNKRYSEFYFGFFNQNNIYRNGIYLWLEENAKTKPFNDFDSSNFTVFIGKFRDQKLKYGTYLTKSENDYYVYHGGFDEDGKRFGKDCYNYSASKEICQFGNFQNDEFILGGICHYNYDGIVDNCLKLQNGNIQRFDDIPQEERKNYMAKTQIFRNTIMEKDYFGDIFAGFQKVYEYESNIKSVDFFNSDDYVQLVVLMNKYNFGLNVCEDIERYKI